jgi:rubrerythrin
MNKTRNRRFAILAASVLTVGILAGSLLATAPNAAQAPTKSLENLQTAFNGESNAHARYLAFAQKADEEGYGQVASLFRAAARAEKFHAANHAEVIKAMGGTPVADVKTPDVKSTRENLQAAIEGESYERDTMYPDFLKQARRERNKAAIKTFNYAKTAETEHAKMYTQALSNLDGLKGSSKMTYYVCTVCGYTTTKIDFDKCPSCFNPVDKYITVD